MDGSNARITKKFSISFSVDTVVTSQDIVVGLDCAGIDIDTNISIQWKASNSTWVTTFDSKVTRDGAHIEPSISVGGVSTAESISFKATGLPRKFKMAPEPLR